MNKDFDLRSGRGECLLVRKAELSGAARVKAPIVVNGEVIGVNRVGEVTRFHIGKCKKGLPSFDWLHFN
jgi:hypothetical protein